MSIKDRVDSIVSQLNEKKGGDIEVLNLEGVDYIADVVIIATSLSGKHTISLAYHLKDELKRSGESILHIDESERWVVIDIGDIIVHIMSAEYRELYSVESFLKELLGR